MRSLCAITTLVVLGLVGCSEKAGDPGAPGMNGANGAKGADGANGLPGPAGPRGADGILDIELDAGSEGGLVGPRGATGPEGPIGPHGFPGPAGAQGPSGPAGAQGPIGPAGAQGLIGPAGAVGPAGPAGAQGPSGPAGAQGPTGAPGAAGPAGAVGPAGPAGVVKVLDFDAAPGALDLLGSAGTSATIPAVCRTASYVAGANEIAVATFNISASTDAPSATQALYLDVMLNVNGGAFAYLAESFTNTTFNLRTAHLGSTKRRALTAGNTYVFAAGFGSESALAVQASSCQGTVLIVRN